MALATREFLGKVAIVTGSTSGIGRALVQAFAKEGTCVTVTGRNGKALEEVSKECQDAGLTKDKILCIQGDITDDETCKKLVNETISRFNKLDILVNNAAITRISNVDQTTMDQFDSIWNVSCRSAVLMTKLAIPHLIETKGNIINMSSVAGTLSVRNYFHYSMTKAALNHFTRCAALEFGERGVRVNTVSPGPVQTPMFSGLNVDERFLKRYEAIVTKFTPLKRFCASEDVVNMVMFLISNKASFLTGTLSIVDGGAHNLSVKLVP